MVRVLPALALSSLAACSDYELKAKETPARPGDGESGIPDDTGPDVEPIECDTTGPEAGTVTVDESCGDEPDIGTFNPVVEWRWEDNPTHPGYHQIMSAPVVANLTDDNGDGVIDANDTPDVAFIAYGENLYSAGEAGVLVILDGATGAELYYGGLIVSGGGAYKDYAAATGGVALAEVNGDGRPDACFPTAAGQMVCLDANGETAFEILSISAHENGLAVTFTKPLRLGDGIDPAAYDVTQWRYVPTAQYGGPKVDEETLSVSGISLSEDRTQMFMAIDGLKPGHMVRLRATTQGSEQVRIQTLIAVRPRSTSPVALLGSSLTKRACPF